MKIETADALEVHAKVSRSVLHFAKASSSVLHFAKASRSVLHFAKASRSMLHSFKAPSQTEATALPRDPLQDTLLDQAMATGHPKQVPQGPQEAGQLTHSLMAAQLQEHGPAQLAFVSVASPGHRPRLAKGVIKASTEYNIKEDSGLDATRGAQQAGKTYCLTSKQETEATRVVTKIQSKLGPFGLNVPALERGDRTIQEVGAALGEYRESSNMIQGVINLFSSTP